MFLYCLYSLYVFMCIRLLTKDRRDMKYPRFYETFWVFVALLYFAVTLALLVKEMLVPTSTSSFYIGLACLFVSYVWLMSILDKQ